MTFPFVPRQDHALVMLGQAVRRARAGAGLSQRGLETRTGVHQTTISRMERGVAPGMALEKFARVAAVLADHLLVPDRVLPGYQLGPAIPAFWRELTVPPDPEPASDASSRFAEVAEDATASLLSFADPEGRRRP